MFNPTKIILLLVVVGVAFYLWQMWRRQQVAAAERAAKPDSGLPRGVEDTRFCGSCGAYVTGASVRECARTDCALKTGGK